MRQHYINAVYRVRGDLVTQSCFDPVCDVGWVQVMSVFRRYNVGLRVRIVVDQVIDEVREQVVRRVWELLGEDRHRKC
jgi:hypothetical protein